MKDIYWIVNRLKSMNASEVVWRVQQKLLQKKEKKRIYELHLPVTKIPLSKKMQGMKPDTKRIPFNAQNANTSIFESLDIFGQFDYQKYKKKWNAGFQTENTWPDKDFSANIAISQREDIGDIRTNWELNRHFQFACLAKNYFLTRESKYLDELIDLFEDWNNHNLFLHGAEWISAMEVGIRVNSWIYTYVFLDNAYKKYSGNKKVLLDELAHGILVMVEHIVKHRARFSSANNHLIVEMFAVGMAGVLFDKKDWIDLSIKILTEELPKQNYEDGVNKEMSLHYQSLVMEAYGIFWLTLEKNGITVPASWKQYLTAMSKYLADCCGNYGEVVIFGDNDEGKILDLQGKVDDYYRYVLQLMGTLLEQRYTDEPLIENMEWLLMEKRKSEYWKKTLYCPSEVCFYKKGGYTILRSRDRKVLVGIDHAELGFGKIAAHGHADALSIQLYYKGKPVLVDSGTYNYHVPKITRNEIRSTRAHNTVSVEKINQAEMLGPFLWGKRYTIDGAQCNLTETAMTLRCTVKYKGIKHTRGLTFDFNRTIQVSDILQTSRGGTQIWILDKDFFDSKEAYTLDISGFCQKEQVYYSSSYGHKTDGVKIMVHFTGNLNMKLTLR